MRVPGRVVLRQGKRLQQVSRCFGTRPAVSSVEHKLERPVSYGGVDRSLVDTFGRKHTYLRVSLTDRCNLRCAYCMPEEGEETMVPNANTEVLTGEELHRIFRLFVNLGVRKIRLTGGEPTIRGDFGQIVEGLGQINAELPEPLSLGITTNGVRLQKFLPKLREAGLRNINMSLDTLVTKKFPLIGRKPIAWHERVLETMRVVAEQEEHFNLKLNVVVLRGVNEDEIGDFVDLTEKMPIEVRFLEFMPFDGNAWSEGRLVSQTEILDAVQKHLSSRSQGSAERLPPDSPNDVARLWKVPSWRGRLGVISSMTNAFCGGCNRMRMTSDGELRNCLFGEEGWSLRDQMRAGSDDEALTRSIAVAVGSKYARFGGKKDMHELNERGGLALPMVALGG